jgi:hypothetical protein
LVLQASAKGYESKMVQLTVAQKMQTINHNFILKEGDDGPTSGGSSSGDGSDATGARPEKEIAKMFGGVKENYHTLAEMETYLLEVSRTFDHVLKLHT